MVVWCGFVVWRGNKKRNCYYKLLYILYNNLVKLSDIHVLMTTALYDCKTCQSRHSHQQHTFVKKKKNPE